MAEFYMPAEWEAHAATWLAWPHEASDWPGKFEAIPWVYGEIVRHLSKHERVRILAGDDESEQDARGVLRKCGAEMEAVDFFRVATDRSWTRDFCPTFVKRAGVRALLNWQFNGWAKYENNNVDNAVTPQLGERLDVQVWTPEYKGKPVVLEGGSIDVNGAGSILTTEECLLSEIQARNPGLGRTDYEAIFGQYLGVNHTVWLRNGISGDDTHGHIDDLARFTDKQTIVIATERNRDEANYEALAENLALLQQARDPEGAPFRVETLPMPEPVFFDDQRLPASYANFYIANECVLVPTFNDAQDRVALDKLAALFPTRTVVGIASTDLVLGLGTLHCMTQQEPG